MPAMTSKWKALPLLALACLLGGAIVPNAADGAGRKKGKFFVSFHVQGDKSEGKRRVQDEILNGETVYFRRTPIITHKQFDGYWPFPADDGTYGVAFHLNSTGRRRMSMVTVRERGKLMRTVVNMRKVDVLRIDRPPNDGIIVVWKGITDKELKEIAKIIPQISEQ